MALRETSDKITRGLARLRQIWLLDQHAGKVVPPTRQELSSYTFYDTPHGKSIPPRRRSRRQKTQH